MEFMNAHPLITLVIVLSAIWGTQKVVRTLVEHKNAHRDHNDDDDHFEGGEEEEYEEDDDEHKP